MRTKSLLTLAFLLGMLRAAPAQDSPNVIPFQGQLANQAGQPLTPANAVTLVFRLYTAPVGGMAIWEESQPGVSVSAGRFSVLLGSRTILPAQSYFNSTLYLGITVDDGNPGTADVEMRPRQAIVPVISARYAQNASTLQGYGWSALFGTNNPVDGKLQGTRIADRTITTAQIATSAIGSNEIAAGSVLAFKLANDAVTTAKITNGSVDFAKLAQEVRRLLPPPGAIVAFGGTGDAVPEGWLLCDGQTVNRTDYSELFRYIGTFFGTGDGTTATFSLPDLRGVFLRGVDVSPGMGAAGRDPNAIARTSIRGGNDGARVGSYQADEFYSHNHAIVGTEEILNGHDPNPTNPYGGFSGGGLYQGIGNPDVSITARGGSETRAKNVYVNYIIRY